MLWLFCVRKQAPGNARQLLGRAPHSIPPCVRPSDIPRDGASPAEAIVHQRLNGTPVRSCF